MKYLFAAAIFLFVIAETPAQQVEAKSVTITSYVFGNRYCAQASALGTTFAKILGDSSSDIPGPTGDCVKACTPDGDRFLIIHQNEKMVSFKAKDTTMLKSMCGKKVIVAGIGTPTEKDNVFLIDIETVKPFDEPEKKTLVESATQSAKFNQAAEKWFEALKKKHLGNGTTAVSDASQKTAEGLIETTADQAMWNLLRAYDFNMRRWFISVGLAGQDAAKVTELDAEWKPILEKCRDNSYRNLLLRAGPPSTECGRVASMKQ